MKNFKVSDVTIFNMKRVFHSIAKEGRAITLLRQIHAKRGLHLSPYRAELIITLSRLKKQWLKK